MNEPDDRPTTPSAPGPQAEPPDTGGAGAPASPGGPPAEPEAPWPEMVDPEPLLVDPFRSPAAPPPPPPPPPARPARAATATDDEDDIEDDGDYLDVAATRWVSLLATIGTALIGIVTVQVVTSLVEGLSLSSGQRVQIPDDLLHRIGYPFGGLGATALVFLVIGVVLVSMPSVLDELLSESQDRVVGAALVVAMVMAVLIAVGSLLAVRANLHEYAAKNVAVPTYVRVQFTNFLLGSLGAAALTLFGAIASMNERSREQLD
ncbi:MAG: hypothetical protein ACR2HM_07490 [Acidimicrobiales bacterium]